MAKLPLKIPKLTGKNYYFQPKWSLTIITVLLLALFLRLGFWQVDRAEEKNLLEQHFAERSSTPPIPLDMLTNNPSDWNFVSVVVTGTYDNDHNILLDNKIHQHRVGYEILTPMHIPGKKYAVLINRGWIPAPRERNTLPNIPTTNNEQTITGTIYIPPQKFFTLKNVLETQDKWPLRVQTSDITDLEKRLNIPLYPFVIRLNADQPDGFVRDWQPINMSPYKHLGYAVQWFTFALVLLIIFIALNIRKR